MTDLSLHKRIYWRFPFNGKFLLHFIRIWVTKVSLAHSCSGVQPMNRGRSALNGKCCWVNYVKGYFRTTKNVFAFSRVKRERIFIWYVCHTRHGAHFTSLSSCDLYNKFMKGASLSSFWLHSIVNVLNATWIVLIKRVISCSVNFTSI